MTAPSLIGAVQVWPGEARPDQTLGLMKEMTLHEYETPELVEVAADIADEVDGKDDAAIARAILEWMREHTRFVPDPINQQLLKTPIYMLTMIRERHKVAGDCVDIAMLSAALCMAVGLTVKFVAESYATPCNAAKAPLVHVYTVAQTHRGWLALDTQQPPNGTPVRPCRRVELPLQ